MEKKGNSCPLVMCEKIYRKVAVSPAFQTIRRISHRLHQPTYSSPASKSSASSPPVKTAIQSKPAKQPRSGDDSLLYGISAEATPVMAPIKFDYSNQQNNTQAAKFAHKNEHEATHSEGSEANHRKKPYVEDDGKSWVHIEDRVTEYIKRAKSKIRRTVSNNPGEGKKSSGSGNDKLPGSCAPGKDKFADYIERTKKKLRTTSSMGVGKRSSFK